MTIRFDSIGSVRGKIRLQNSTPHKVAASLIIVSELIIAKAALEKPNISETDIKTAKEALEDVRNMALKNKIPLDGTDYKELSDRLMVLKRSD